MGLSRYIKNKKRDVQFDFLWNNAYLSGLDSATLVASGLLLVYLTAFQPAVVLVACFSCAIAAAFSLLNQGLKTATGYSVPIKTWHLAAVILALTAIFGQTATPAFAQFFNSLEQAVQNVVSNANTGISQQIVSTIFAFFRVLILLAFIIGVVVVFAQATRGNDWQPIANLLAVGVAFVIGVEIISQLILGGAGGGQQGGGSP
jgi:hypothetical protein